MKKPTIWDILFMLLENQDLLKEMVNMWWSICPIWNYYDYASGYFGIMNSSLKG